MVQDATLGFQSSMCPGVSLMKSLEAGNQNLAQLEVQRPLALAVERCDEGRVLDDDDPACGIWGRCRNCLDRRQSYLDHLRRCCTPHDHPREGRQLGHVC
jgi:hypothetical protein